MAYVFVFVLKNSFNYFFSIIYPFHHLAMTNNANGGKLFWAKQDKHINWTRRNSNKDGFT